MTEAQSTTWHMIDLRLPQEMVGPYHVALLQNARALSL